MPGFLNLFSIGVFVGYVSGLFGKGGSAVATPLLQLAGVPAFLAVASPLPAAIPGTVMATLVYLRRKIYDKDVILWSVIAGFPATILGAWLSKFTSGTAILLLSNVTLIFLGAAFIFPEKQNDPQQAMHALPSIRRSIPLNLAIAGVVGLVSGLLANAGGFLLAPLYAKVLRVPLKVAFACSMIVSAVLAVPGTLVHMELGHISWRIVLYFGLGSIPLSYLGARTAVRMPLKILTPVFGLVNVVIGILGAMDSLGLHWLHL
jgi:hypothetical protein